MSLSVDEAPASPPTSRGPGPWRVLLADHRKNLFQVIKDDRLEIQRSYDPARPPHLIVCPCPKLSGTFDNPIKDLPSEAFAGAAVALDATGKGNEPPPLFSETVQEVLAARGVPEERCALVTNN